MKHLLRLADLTREEIGALIERAIQFKKELRQGERHQHLRGKTLGMLLWEESCCDRVPFEAGMCQLGGSAVRLSREDAREDTIRVASRWLDGLMLCGMAQEQIGRLASYSAAPVINGGSESAQPCTALCGLMTVQEHKGYLDGLHLCYVGEGGPAANSLIVGALRMGMQVVAATPEDCQPSEWTLDFARSYGGRFRYVHDAQTAANDAEVVFTGAWSRPQGADRAYQVNSELLGNAIAGAMVLHLLPARRGGEIARDVFEEHAAEIFTMAENRLHIQKAALVRAFA